MNTEKKWVDHWADFCTNTWKLNCHMQNTKKLPASTYTKEQAVVMLNNCIYEVSQNCNPHIIHTVRRMVVRSKSVTWRSLAQRMEALCDLCIMPRG